MIINCPRCGFSQPQDQYCAQCGVNMQSFRPAEKSLAKKLSENLAIQVLALILIAGVAGSYMIRSESSTKWVQKLTRFQGVNKSSKANSDSANSVDAIESNSSSAKQNDSLADLQNREIVVEKSEPTSAEMAAGLPAQDTAPLRSADAGSANEIAMPTFKIIYAEVPIELLAKWVAESSRLGLFQNLQEYSAGILPEFRKRSDGLQVLKTDEKKLGAGQSDILLSGTVGDDGQMIGLSTNLEIKSVEGGAVHGALVVTRALRQGREVFPAEFDLNKGAAFFIVDVINRQSFAAERAVLTMAPFQVFKSVDFMSQKTKFVILLEPSLK